MISVPQQPKVTALGENHSKFEILGCYPGYGATLGNAIRRVLLSSLEGAAARSVKIKGVSHEFTSIPGVMEDAVQILLNLKQLRFRLHGDETVKVTLKAKGEGDVKAGDIKAPSSVEIVNPDQRIATLTDKKAEFEMELEIGKGIGYVPVEAREHEELRLRIELERAVSLARIDAQKSVAAAQAQVLGEALGHADIRLIGGDGGLFERIAQSVSMGQAIDQTVGHSETLQKLLAPYLSGERQLPDDLTALVGQLSGGGLKDLAATAALARLASAQKPG